MAVTKRQERMKKESINRIEEVLRNSVKGLTYTKLQIESGLPLSVFNARLHDLESKGLVVRDYEGPRRLLIKPAPQLLDPVRATLMRFELVAASYSDIRAEDAERFLDKSTAEGLWEIASLYWVPSKKKFFCYRDKIKKIMVESAGEEAHMEKFFEFNEYTLLKGLSRYCFEGVVAPGLVGVRRFSKIWPHVFADGKQVDLKIIYAIYSSLLPFSDYEEFKEFYRSKASDPLCFPAMAIADERNISKNLDALLQWLRPFTMTPFFTKMEWSHRNLVSGIFSNELLDYVRELSQAWEKLWKKRRRR